MIRLRGWGLDAELVFLCAVCCGGTMMTTMRVGNGELEMTMMISSTAATLTGELVNNLVCGSVSFTNPFGYVLMLSHVHVSF